MMKNYFPKSGFQNYFLFLTFLVVLFLTHVTTFAQHPASIEKGILRIKVSENLAAQLEAATTARTADNLILTGVQAIDNVSQRYRAHTLKRVFREAGKFEAKHRRYGLHRWYEVKMDLSSSVLDAMRAYDDLKEVERSEPVYTKALVGSKNKNFGPRVIDEFSSLATLPGASNDPLVVNQWHYNNTGQTGGIAGADIKLFQAWGLETGKSQVIVAVTDGGIQASHPDLSANIWINAGEVPGNNIDDDNNGFVDDINGYGFGDDTGTIIPNQHGTHVGGTVAATTNNGIGVAGVAGGSGNGDGARLMSCAAFGGNDNGGFAETYVYAADNGAVISQNSWGYEVTGAFEQAVLDGIDYFIAEAGKDDAGNQIGPMKGGIVIFSAGNEDDDAEHYPAFYEHTLSVSAITHRNKKSYYSNYGEWVDIAATGGETNTVTQQGILSTLSNSQYGYFQGTSMSAPHVSGVAALIVSKLGGAGLTPELVRARLIQTSDNIDAFDPPFAGLLGAGRLNAFASLQENDNIAPNAITDLHAVSQDITSITLSWTAPGDEGNGSASLYDIRYATSPIDSNNFSLANIVPNLPIPGAAGSIERVTVSDLLPGTEYYFAVKSLDFFGNESELSNVVRHATDFPPAISVSPLSIYDTLVTAATSIKTITLSNTGQGPLYFTIEGFEDSFITPSVRIDSIAAGDSLNVSLTLDANNLLAGTYRKDLTIRSNDPEQDSLLVSVVLQVINNGSPIAILSPTDTLDIGDVFIGGEKSKTVTIHNSGSEILSLDNISITGTGFTSDFSDTLFIQPFNDATLTIHYAASSLGQAWGTVAIITNDPADPIRVVALRAEGVEAPGIAVTPAAFEESLFEGKSSIHALTVTNTGGSDLEISVDVSAATSYSFTVKQISLPVSANIHSNTARKQNSKTKRISSAKVEIKSSGKLSSAAKVLIFTPDEDVSDLLAILNSFDDIHAVAYPVELLPAVTAEELVAYDVVMTTNNGQWLSSGNVDPVYVGDVLADYVDLGGKLIVNEFAYSYDAWKMQGRFITQQYGPFVPATTDEEADVSLGNIISPSHPILKNVSALDYSGFVQNVGLAPGAVALAAWSNGELFAAANANVVALNLLPSLGDGSSLPWNGDLPTFYQNAIHWLVGPSFVKVDPKKATVAPGEQIDLAVTFNADGLTQGDYFAAIDINTNVPTKESISVPVTLHVLGPEFSVAPDSLYVSADKGQVVSKTIVLTNHGNVDQNYKVSVLNKGSVDRKALMKTSLEKVAKPFVSSKRKISNDKSFNILPIADKHALHVASNAAARSLAIVQHGVLYTTDFEAFAEGDIDEQEGWAAQYGNWVVDTVNPSSESKHLHAVADGQGQTLAFSPEVGIGTKAKSTATMKMNIQGSGVTWQVIPQSTTAELVNTRISFGADGKVTALVSNGADDALYADVPATVPEGYFDFTIEIDRASSVFSLYFNDDKVFTGQGFVGDIEQVVLLSLMEEVGPVLDVDDLKIFDGERDLTPSYITVSPITGTISAGQSVTISVTFDATKIAYGKYQSDVIVTAGTDRLVVPTILDVKGDAAIEVNPTVLQAKVPYREDTVKTFTIKNTGGSVLTYSMQVIGAGTTLDNMPSSPINKFAGREVNKRIDEKVLVDDQRSKARQAISQNALELLTGAALLEENFEGQTFPPSGWKVKDNAGNGVVWDFASAIGEGNYAGTGEAATASSDAFGEADFDTELITPFIDISKYQNVTLQYMANYQNYANYDYLDLDIRVDGDSTWKNVLQWNEDHGDLRLLSGEFVSLSLSEFIGDGNSFQLRWHYYDPNEADYDWYAQIDNVVILGDPRAWLSVSPASGQLPIGEVEEIEAHFNARDLEPGAYVAGILLSSNAVKNPLVGIVASLEVMNPAKIAVTPDAVEETLLVGNSASKELIITNDGESPLKFSFEGIAIQGATEKLAKRIEQPAPRTTFVSSSRETLSDRKAIVTGKLDVLQHAGSSQYATGFEEFAPGDINTQNGWSGQYGNWTIEGENAYSGSLHLRGLADGQGRSLAFSPETAIGTETTSSAVMKVDFSSALGATWQIIPQSISAELVNTRIQIGADGILQALVVDSLGEAYFDTISVVPPTGYVELKIEIERATALFRVYFDDEKVFVGQGFTGDIEQIVLLSLMETAGPVFDIDNLAILDGTPQQPWLSVNPLKGVVPSGGLLPVTVTFDAKELTAGVYTDTLNIISNDPLNTTKFIPATLRVIDNLPPVLDVVNDTTVVETGVINLSFAATDPDDKEVKVFLRGAPSFISVDAQSYGSANYVVKPKIGDKGVYKIKVIAQDVRGLSDSLTFNLTVLPYGVSSFSLVNATTGKVIVDFDDTLTVDIAHPDFSKYTIRANTKPGTVGSVIFKVDGSKRNTENLNPYVLDRSVFTALKLGAHKVVAEAYTKAHGKGIKGAGKNATVNVINTAAITSFDVVNVQGKVLMRLAPGSTINIKDPAFAFISIIANTGDSKIGSVYFKLNSFYHTENIEPYSLNGNEHGFFAPWPFKVGKYSITATPYSKDNRGGVAGKSLTINFEVVKDKVGAIAAREDMSPEEETLEVSEETTSSWVVYPVPVNDELNLRVEGEATGNVDVTIVTIQGRKVYSQNIPVEKLTSVPIRTSEFAAGTYYIQLIDSKGKRSVKKFTKR